MEQRARKGTLSSGSGNGNKDGAAPAPQLLPDIRSFLRPVGGMESRYVRLLSSLCAISYNLEALTVSESSGDFGIRGWG